MIGLGRRKVPRGISAKKSQNFNEKIIFVRPVHCGILVYFSLRLGPPAKEIWRSLLFDAALSESALDFSAEFEIMFGRL